MLNDLKSDSATRLYHRTRLDLFWRMKGLFGCRWIFGASRFCMTKKRMNENVVSFVRLCAVAVSFRRGGVNDC